jgi:hypothetical protein
MRRSSSSVLVAVSCFLFACSAEAGASDIASYLCTGEQATGFGMNSKTHAWTVQKFRTRKYIIRAPIKGPNAPGGAYAAVVAVYEVGKVDAANATAFCDKDYNEAGFLFCSGLGEDLNFNRQTLRFVHWFPYGYIDPPESSFWGKEGEATPFMEIGTCTAI